MSVYCTDVHAADFHPDTRAFFQGRTVAVTGGAGFIGSHVVEQLLALESQPIVLSRQASPPFLACVRDRVEFRQCNLLAPEETADALSGVSVVLNMAALVAGLEFNKAHPASIFHANMQMFLNVIAASHKHRVDRFLVTSSACVYPRHCTIPTPEEEGFRDEPEPTNSGYGWAKRMQEFLGAQYAAEFGMSIAIARPYNAYGPRDNFLPSSSHVIPALIRKAFETRDGWFPVWGDGSHSRSFLYVDDFARGLLEVAARYPAADAVNLGAHEEISIAALAHLIGEFVSERRGMPVGPQFEPAGLTGQPRRCCHVEKAIRTLGYHPLISLREGLERTIDWFHAYHALPANAQ